MKRWILLVLSSNVLILFISVILSFLNVIPNEDRVLDWGLDKEGNTFYAQESPEGTAIYRADAKGNADRFILLDEVLETSVEFVRMEYKDNLVITYLQNETLYALTLDAELASGTVRVMSTAEVLAADRINYSKDEEIPLPKNRYATAMKLSGSRMISVAVVMLAILLVFDILMYFIMESRSYFLRYFAVTAIILFFVFIGFSMISYYSAISSLKLERMKGAGSLLALEEAGLDDGIRYKLEQDGFEGSEAYEALRKQLSLLTAMGQQSKFMREAFAASVGDDGKYMITTSLPGSSGKTAEDVYGKDMEEFLLGIAQNEITQDAGYLTIRGREYGAAAVAIHTGISSRHYLIALVPLDGIEKQALNRCTSQLGIMFLITLIGMGMLALVRYWEGREMSSLVNAMEGISRETAGNLDKPRVSCNEMDKIWNSLLSISANKDKLYYSRNRILQVYYRFTPRNIERLLGKESIADVAVGDSVNMTGTIGMISIAGNWKRRTEHYVDNMNRNLETICRYQLEQGGVLLSNDSNLTSMKVLFVEGTENAVQFGIDTMHELYENNVLNSQNILIFLHNTALQYGVAGTNEQTFPFMVSQDTDAMNSYLIRLRELAVRMVITETVAAKLGKHIEKRYLGYVELAFLKTNIKIYEVLDAYSEQERKQKMKMDSTFQKALQLYYKNDFYLARNHFTEVIKGCPGDLIAKWYVFSCERMLSDGNLEQFRYGLFFE